MATEAIDKMVNISLKDSKEYDEKTKDGLHKNRTLEPQKGDRLPKKGGTGSQRGLHGGSAKPLN